MQPHTTGAHGGVPLRHERSARGAWFKAAVIELLLVVLVAFFGAGTARSHMGASDVMAPACLNDPMYYLPAVMIAAGHGFTEPESTDIPGLREFLALETYSLPPGAVPEQIHTVPVRAELRGRRYLIGAVGWVWRLFGVSWNAFPPMVLLCFAISAIAVYGIFRLGTSRAFAFAGTLASVVAFSAYASVPSLRDLSKGPFLLGIIFLLGLLLRLRIGPGRGAVLAAALGVLTGIGAGFRQDLIICVAPCLFVLMVGPRERTKRALTGRVLAALVYTACLALAGGPVLTSFDEGGSEFSHNIVKGLGAEEHDAAMELSPASYDHLSQSSDLFVHLVPRDFYHRTAPPETGRPFFDEHAAEPAFVREFVKTFPADAAARGLASTLRIIRFYPAQSPLYIALGGLGICAMVFTLLVLSRYSIWRAWLLLLLILYFCAYPCLQFQERHFYHLTFLHFWFLTFALEYLWRRYRARAASHRDAAGTAQRRTTDGMGRSPSRKMALFALSAALAVLLPLAALRLYQYRTVGHLLDSYYDKTCLDRLAVQEHRFEDVTAFSLEEPLIAYDRQPTERWWRSDYMVLELAAAQPSTCFWLRYAVAANHMDFSQPIEIRLPQSSIDPDGVCRCFFPVYEHPMVDRDWSRFEGVVLSNQDAALFRGLYRVNKADHFRMYPVVFLPPERSQFKCWQSISLFGKPRPYRSCICLAGPHNPFFHDGTAQSIGWFMAGDSPQPVSASALVETCPDIGIAWHRLGQARESEGQQTEAIEAYRKAITASPNLVAAYWALGNILDQDATPPSRVEEMRLLVQAYDHAYAAHMALGLALESAGNLPAAREAYSKGGELLPVHPTITRALKRLADTPAETDRHSIPQ